MLLQGVLIAQKTPYVNLDVSSGLPSNMAFHVVEDAEGYIWVATTGGIARFDGYEFKTLTIDEGLPETTTLKFWPDASGRLWGQTYPNGYYTIEQGKVEPFPHNVLMKNLPNWNGVDGRPSWDEEQQTLSIYQSGRYKRIDTAGAHFNTRLVSGPKTAKKLVLIENENGIFPLITDRLLSDSGLDSLEGRLQIDSVAVRRQVYYPVRAGKKIYVGIDNNLYVFDAHGKVTRKKFSKDVVYCGVSPIGEVVVGLYRGGLQFLDANLNLQKAMLPEKTPSSFFWDKTNGLWVSTLQAGVFYYPSITFKVDTRFPATQISKLTVHGKDLIVGCADGRIFSNSDSLELPDQRILNKFRDFQGVTWLNEEPWLVGRLKKSDVEFNPNEKIIDGSRALMDGEYVFVLSNHILKAFRLETKEKRVLLESTSTLYDLALYNGVVIVVSKDEVFAFDSHTLERVKCPIPSLKNLQLYGLSKWQDGLIGGPISGGLVFIGDSGISELSKKNGLFNDWIPTFCTTKDEVWAGAAGGISLIKRLPDGNLKVLNTLPCPGNGIPNCLAFFEDKLWVGTNDGVYTMEVVREDSITKMPFYIETMLVDGQPIDTAGDLLLPSDWSSLGFRYLGLNFRRLGVLEYRYRLLGFRDNWEYSRGRLAQYAGLTPGDYTFEVEVKDNLGNWGNHVQRISFVVPLPWWQQWWALGLGFLLLLGMVFSGFYLQRRRFKNIQFVTELRSSILRSQMNPHFTFNALTIIRSLILQGKSEEADRTLLRFSRLIRNILDLSSREYLTLEEEVAFLTDYLEVERSRANGQFNFQITQSEGIDLMQELPSMVLQPFVENAIIHGLRPLEGREGKLEITFEMPAENRLCIRVTDNGVGRGATAQLPKNHESKGMSITQKRLRILDPKAKIEITDLFAEDGAARGTQVALQFHSKPWKKS
ncbi:MAG: histidine kinase [Salibacteraceae bacterium]